MRKALTRLFLIALIALAMAPLSAFGRLPSLVSYQGRLTTPDGLPVPDGNHQLSFVLYADSTGGSPLWAEASSVTTEAGLFVHLLGSEQPLLSSLWSDYEALFLEIIVGGQAQLPRARITSVPYAQVASALELRDASDSLAIWTESSLVDGQRLMLKRPSDDSMTVILSTTAETDSAVILPPGSINTEEMFNEPGFTLGLNVFEIELVEMHMADLVTVEIEIPTDGYILLDGKCYVMLDGTTGPNVALIQIDEEEGGNSQFPYYTLAGLNGYVNTGQNFFPVHVTRLYYKQAGQYTFRMEGRAEFAPPASARSWDHVLRAMFMPTYYGFVSSVTTDPGGDPNALQLDVADPRNPNDQNQYYEIDLRRPQDRTPPGIRD